MRPAILALGVFGTVVGLFLFVTGYDMASMPPNYLEVSPYRENYYDGVGLETSGGITTAMGLAIAVFGAASKEKEPRRPEARDRDRPVF